MPFRLINSLSNSFELNPLLAVKFSKEWTTLLIGKEIGPLHLLKLM